MSWSIDLQAEARQRVSSLALIQAASPITPSIQIGATENQPPVIEVRGDRAYAIPAGTHLRFGIGVADADDPVGTLSVTLSAADPSLMAQSTVEGTSFERSVNIDAAYQLGTTLLTLRVQDARGGFSETTVKYTVTLPSLTDFGDAPVPYPVRIADHGAWHVIHPGLRLGAAVDSESDGQPSITAIGDDGANVDDEDGVTWPANLRGGQTNGIRVVVTAAGRLDAWIDANRDGRWDEATEKILRSVPVTNGINLLGWVAPSNSVSGAAFARVRYSVAGGLSPEGGAPAGEVEDYQVNLVPVVPLLNFGTAPAPFPTTLAEDGARHTPTRLILGRRREIEADGIHGTNAPALDDDGVSVTSPLIPGDSVLFMVTSSTEGKLDGWIDFNGDGDWSDPDEQVFARVPVTAGVTGLHVAVPTNAVPGRVFARFRLSSSGGLGVTGLAGDGEVEDYAVTIPPPTEPCQISRIGDARRPNVIVILADDLGYSDLGAQGGREIPTPHIDSLARSGVRFTSGYVTASVCSPSRAGLMTGRYQQRFGHETNPGTSLERNPSFGLPLTESTLGDRFKALNYSTGWIGKSHLGGTEAYHPQQRGFDEYFGFIESHHDYFDTGVPLTNQHDPILRGRMPVVETNYLTTAFARECVRFIDQHAPEPFLLYAPFNAVHFPLEATPSLLTRAAALPITSPTRRTMAAMLLGLDDAVGAILASLRLHNIETNTLIIFTTDNGGSLPFGARNDPLRGEKTELYEGGIRVPYFMQWKGHLPAGLVYHAPVSTLDILPTAVAAAGGEVAGAWQLDGVNLLPFLCDENAGVPHPQLFWRVETDGLSPGGEVKDGLRAIREGDWKLIKPGAQDTWELYNLSSDIGERVNLANDFPDVVQRLTAAYQGWSAQMSRPLWAVDDLHYETPEFVREDIRLGMLGIAYLGPEFHPGTSQMSFQDAHQTLWMTTVDTRTGFLASGHGLDLSLDTGLAPLERSITAAQWGISSWGASLYYHKLGSTGRLEIWQADATRTSTVPARVTSDPANDHLGVIASQLPFSPSVKLAFGVGTPLQSMAVWADEAQPTLLTRLPNGVPGFNPTRWLPNAADLIYAGQPPGVPLASELTLYQTIPGSVQFLSDDRGDEKTDIWGFLAPEFNYELCYVAVRNHSAIDIYRQLPGRPNGIYSRVETLTIPTNLPPRFIYSLQPLPGLRGFNGVSYFSCAAYEHDDPQNPGDAEMWVVGLGPDPDHHVVRRVDEGAGSGIVARRREPRTFAGSQELFYYYTRILGTNDPELRLARTGVSRPDFTGNASGFTQLHYSPSFQAGTNDGNGTFLGGTETLHLASHRGRLYASQGSRGNFPYPTNLHNPAALPAHWSGAQILVKDSTNGPWRADTAVPDIFRIHQRVEALMEVTFSTDHNASILREPVHLLVAGLSDLGELGSHQASVRTRRDTPPATWEESHVATTPEPAYTLSFGLHRDRQSDVHHIFAGLSNGEIFRGAYHSNAPGQLEWATQRAELTGPGPVTAFAECNGVLYAACGLRQAQAGAPVEGGLYLRVDSNQSWVRVHQGFHPTDVIGAPEEHRLVRGLTAVPEPHGGGREVLLAARAWPGVIERIDPDPDRGHVVTVELDVRDYFARFWADDRARDGSVTIGYTGFLPVTDPVTGERVHLIGLWVEHPDSPAPQYDGTRFLVRHLDGTYEPVEVPNVFPSRRPGIGLGATRCLAQSPFPEDRGGVFYLGGYDTADGEAQNTAWVVRGDWQTWPALSIHRISGSDWELGWPATSTNWVLEVNGGLGAKDVWRRFPGRPGQERNRRTQSVSSPDARNFFRLYRE